jgi:ATP-dependent DNA ligase
MRRVSPSKNYSATCRFQDPKVRDDSIVFNEDLEGDGARSFEHACKLGCEGIVAKRIDLP